MSSVVLGCADPMDLKAAKGPLTLPDLKPDDPSDLHVGEDAAAHPIANGSFSHPKVAADPIPVSPSGFFVCRFHFF